METRRKFSREFKLEAVKMVKERGDALSQATLEWGPWLNHHRLLESIGYIQPAEAEANYYRQLAEKTNFGVLT